jgi:2-amino-4-hydroxy-6-hydroxymethyldihydropteridine diphosphokinase
MGTTIYLSLGSNLGDRLSYLQQATMRLKVGLDQSLVCSPIYETTPWGLSEQPVFLNCCLKLVTKAPPLQVLLFCQQIEYDLGRTREITWGARTIDIDILLYGEQQINLPTLTVPHPQLANRRFILQPFCDIDAAVMHPIIGLTITELLNQCPDKGIVTKTTMQIGV